MKWFKEQTFLFILIAVLNLVLTPITSRFLGVSGEFIAVINFSLVALVSLTSTDRRIAKTIVIVTSCTTLFSVWGEYMTTDSDTLFICRVYSTLCLFIALAYILIDKILVSSFINQKIIFGAMAGYVIIGLVGGNLFELLEYSNQGSLKLDGTGSGYDFYYYSFISLITIGYGDIVPHTPQAKSLTIILGIVGQFYMAVGVALFVGKHLSANKN